MEKVVSRMGIREICIGYGQTEASPIITLTSVDDPIEVRVGTVGRPIPGLEVKLVDPATRCAVPTGETGELCVRGHCVMAGYYSNPAGDRQRDRRRRLASYRRPGRRREDGNYRIVGRSRELIIRGGENIYPAEVEEFLHRHPAVAEVAVAGVPDAKYGEVVAAWFVLKIGRERAARRTEALLSGPNRPLQGSSIRHDRRVAAPDGHGKDPQARSSRPGDRRLGIGGGGGRRNGLNVKDYYNLLSGTCGRRKPAAFAVVFLFDDQGVDLGFHGPHPGPGEVECRSLFSQGLFSTGLGGGGLGVFLLYCGEGDRPGLKGGAGGDQCFFA